MYKEVTSRVSLRYCHRVVFSMAALLALLLSLGCGPSADPVLEKEQEMVGAGIELLRNGTSVQRDSVIRTFNNLSHPELLHPFLSDSDLNVRIGVVSALGNIKDSTAVDKLNSMLLSSDDYLLRETIIWALGELGDTSSVPVLIRIMKDTTENLDLRLGLPITLATFSNTASAGMVEQAFVEVLRNHTDEVELCSYVAVGMLEVLEPGNYDLFKEQLPTLKKMAASRLEKSGEEDGIYTNFQLTVDELEKYQPDNV